MSRAEAAEALLYWAEQTHGNDFGHDHHCRLKTDNAWVDDPGDPRLCHCGWTPFRIAYNRYQEEEHKQLLEPGPR